MADNDNIVEHPPVADVDKEALYGRFFAGEDRKARIYERGVLQSLDLADDEMNVSTRVDRRGLGAGAVSSIAAIAGVPSLAALGLLAWQIMRGDERPAPAPSSPPAQLQHEHEPDTDSALYLLDKRPTPIDQPEEENR